MAQAHAGLGCRVTLVTSGPIASRDDPELVAVLRDRLTEDGVTLIENARIARAEDGPALVLADGRRSPAATCWSPPAASPTSSAWTWTPAT